mgnify:CR=1 FL=1
MREKIILDMLSENSVSIKKQQILEQNGQQYEIGQPWRKAYINSIQGRIDVENEIPKPYRLAIFLMWGENPTVFENED